MKRFLSLLLVCLLSVTLFSGCQEKTPAPETTAATEPALTESPEEANVLKIMILGSSRSVNAFHFLYQAFQDQIPDQKLVLGIMYYSGCSMSMHTKFIQTNQNVYSYYYNDNGHWIITKDCHMDTGLCDQAWDVVVLQAGSGDLENRMNETCRNFLKEYVASRVTTPHVLWWHTTWFNSTTPSLFRPEKTSLDPAKIDQVQQLTESIEAAKAYVLDDPMFEGHVCSGTPMMYALKMLEIPDTDLYRDHTHLSDYGALLVAYAWYAQYTGNPVTQINIDVLDAPYRQSAYRDLGPLVVTQEMKDSIIKTVDYTLNNPWTVPTK